MQKRNAFTLIELLVVIAIIAVLMAILFPALNKAKESAQEVICRSHLKSIGLALTMYAQENDYTLADSSKTNQYYWYNAAGQLRSTQDGDAYWGVAYIDYAKEPRIFGCPSFRQIAGVIATDELLYDRDPKLILASAFCLNSNVSAIKTIRVPNPSQLIVSHDHVEPKIENGSMDMLYNDSPGSNNLRHYRQGGSRANWYRGIFRHSIRSAQPFVTGGRLNLLWLDNHVTTLKETTGDDVPKSWYTRVK